MIKETKVFLMIPMSKMSGNKIKISKKKSLCVFFQVRYRHKNQELGN